MNFLFETYSGVAWWQLAGGWIFAGFFAVLTIYFFVWSALWRKTAKDAVKTFDDGEKVIRSLIEKTKSLESQLSRGDFEANG